MAIEDLTQKQQELMEKVPHTLRHDSLVKMQASAHIIGSLLRYLGSTGHKPWRPIPLSALEQDNLLHAARDKFGALAYIHDTTVGAHPIHRIMVLLHYLQHVR